MTEPLQFLPESLFENAANYLISEAIEPPILVFLDGQYVFRWSEEGRVRTKLISGSSVRAAFANEPIDSGWLSPNIVRCGTSAKGNWSVRFSPPGKVILSVLLEKEIQHLQVPMPGLTFFGINQKYYIWAMKDSEFDPNAALHHAPLPNVGADDDDNIPGRICFGDSFLPDASPAGIEKAWQIFLDTTFTNHLIEGKSSIHEKDIRQALIQLAGKRKYPTKTLVPVYGNQTLDRLINAVTRRY